MATATKDTKTDGKVKVTMNNSSRKYLYVLMSNVRATTFDDVVKLKVIFDEILDAAHAFDSITSPLQQKRSSLENTLQNQIKMSATEVQVKSTKESLEKVYNELEEANTKQVSYEITEGSIINIYNYLEALIQTDLLDKGARADGIFGVNDIMSTENIIQTISPIVGK